MGVTTKLVNGKFEELQNKLYNDIYIVKSISNASRLEAHAGFFRLLVKWIFDPCVL